MDLNKILEDLKTHKSNNREQTLNKYIQKRLTGSLQVYYDELDKVVRYTNSKNELRLLKKINNSNKE